VAVRIALGASDGRIVGMMLRGALAVTGAGRVAGLAAAALFTAGLRGLLFGLGPHDPATLAAVVRVVAAACLLAAWLPARRAAKVQPAELLRGD
jgi:ABC-type antimicrobial peptide transport system permease subunit